MFQFLRGLTFCKNLHCHLNLFMYSNYKTITQIEVTVTVFTAIHFMTVVQTRSMSSVSLICRSLFRRLFILCPKFFYEGPLVFKGCKILLTFTFIQNGTVI
jgi:hypothetical protein